MATMTMPDLNEFLALPETKPASEYVYGEVMQKPMPDEEHSELQFFLTTILRRFLALNPIGRALPEWRCVFGPSGEEQAFVPDVVFATHERHAVQGRTSRKFLWTAPDLAIEILSPDQPAGPFADKILFYLLHGVRLIWVVDPAERTVRVFRPPNYTRILRAGDTLDGEDVLPGFSVAVDDIFAELED